MHFTHIQNGKAQQVDISNKPVAYRRALAEGTIELKSETVDAIKQGSIEKGNCTEYRDGRRCASDQADGLCHPILSSDPTDKHQSGLFRAQHVNHGDC